VKERSRGKREFPSATAAFPTRRDLAQRINRQATAVRTEWLAVIRGPTDALEGVARFVIAHPHDATEAQSASGGTEQEML
jgi:hypothetical protein